VVTRLNGYLAKHDRSEIYWNSIKVLIIMGSLHKIICMAVKHNLNRILNKGNGIRTFPPLMFPPGLFSSDE